MIRISRNKESHLEFFCLGGRYNMPLWPLATEDAD